MAYLKFLLSVQKSHLILPNVELEAVEQGFGQLCLWNGARTLQICATNATEPGDVFAATARRHIVRWWVAVRLNNSDLFDRIFTNVERPAASLFDENKKNGEGEGKKYIKWGARAIELCFAKLWKRVCAIMDGGDLRALNQERTSDHFCVIFDTFFFCSSVFAFLSHSAHWIARAGIVHRVLYTVCPRNLPYQMYK